MMMTTVIAAAVAAAAPAPGAHMEHQHQGQPMQQQKKIEGCKCCKDMAKAEGAKGHDGHGQRHSEPSGK